MRLALIAILLAGCGDDLPGPPRPPDAAEAMHVAWGLVLSQHGADPRHPPMVEWITGADLTCGKDWRIDDTCYGGTASLRPRGIRVAWPNGSRVADGAFAHELCHVLDGDNGGDGDPTHVGPCWAFGSEWVQQAVDTLEWTNL